MKFLKMMLAIACFSALPHVYAADADAIATVNGKHIAIKNVTRCIGAAKATHRVPGTDIAPPRLQRHAGGAIG